MNKERISAMSDEHNAWLNGLSFYKDELVGIKAKLTEIAGKYTSNEVGSEVEHFQNQLLVQGENIDRLHHNINDNLAKVAADVKANAAGYVETALVEAHDAQKETFTSLETVINALRAEFNVFAAKWM